MDRVAAQLYRVAQYRRAIIAAAAGWPDEATHRQFGELLSRSTKMERGSASLCRRQANLGVHAVDDSWRSLAFVESAIARRRDAGRLRSRGIRVWPWPSRAGQRSGGHGYIVRSDRFGSN